LPTHHSDIKLGRSYRDKGTNFEGTATSLHFYEHGVERATLSTLDKNGTVTESTFDAPRLEPSEATGNLGFK
jgi:hypothetical protein